MLTNNWEEYDAWVCIGDAAKMTGSKAEAYSSYEMATWLEPENAKAILRLKELHSADAYRELSELYGSFASSISTDKSRKPTS